MPKSFKTLRGRMTPEAQTRSREKTADIMNDMALQELRNARDLTQGTLAEQLNLEQPAVSELERRADMYVSTLRKCIEAMGGELEIIAHFPEGNVRINQFEDIEQDQAQETVAG